MVLVPCNRVREEESVMIEGDIMGNKRATTVNLKSFLGFNNNQFKTVQPKI